MDESEANEGMMDTNADEEYADEEFDDEDTSDSEDSETERQQHNDWEREVVRLRKELSKTPNAYNLHVELIEMLKKLGELDQLRHARQTMHNIYPLSEDLWLEWLRDEKKLASTDQEKENLEDLFKKATTDYLSIDIWLEFIQFSLGYMEEKDGMTKIRTILEEALRSGGLHVSKGALLWDTFRELELATYKLTANGDHEAVLNQTKIINQLFQRQLSVPLLDMVGTWTEYEDWMKFSNQEVDTHVKNSYEKALNYLEKLTPLENSLLNSTTQEEKLVIYQNYLDIETKESKDPARIQALYERILAELPLYETLWADYCKFVDRQLKIPDTTLSVFNRAVRNCPWSSSIWVEFIFAAERYQKEHRFIAGLVETSFSGGLSQPTGYKDVWLAFIEYIVRKCRWNEEDDVKQVREAFTRATEHLASNFGDPDCAISQYWAYIEAKKLNNISRAREIWKDIFNQGHGKSAQWRLSYINFERFNGGDASHVRQQFQKSLTAVPSTDWPESIVQQWLQFEREEGDFQSMENAKIKCDAKMKKVNEERAKQQTQQAQEEGEKQVSGMEHAKGRKRSKEEKTQESKAPVAKRSKTADAVDVKQPTASAGVASAAPASVISKDPNDPSRHPRTVFVSNLDYKTAEDELRNIFSSTGTITDLRLVRDYKQRSKGYCYVEFSTEDEAKAALKRDREPINGRPMFVSRMETDAALKHPVFKYQVNLEKNKLFVKGLDPKVTKEDILELFSKYGTIKDARIVTYRSGHSKGLAYVDFIDDTSANAALINTDGMIFKEKQISVALSQPPPRKPQAMDGKAVESLLGGGSRTRKSQVSFVPNAVLRQSASASTLMPPPPPKNNEEFRQMLLKPSK